MNRLSLVCVVMVAVTSFSALADVPSAPAAPLIHVAPYRPQTVATATAAGLVMRRAVASDVAPGGAEAHPASVKAVPKTNLPVFAVHAGQNLTVALTTWFARLGWTLDWQAQGATPGRLREFMADSDWATKPKSPQDLLRRTLAGLGVRAQVLDADKRVVVRNDNFSQE